MNDINNVELPRHTNPLPVKDNEIKPPIRINAIPIPKGATNGDAIMTMFPKAWKSNYIDISNKFTLYIDNDYELEVDVDWWNSPYKGVEE